MRPSSTSSSRLLGRGDPRRDDRPVPARGAGGGGRLARARLAVDTLTIELTTSQIMDGSGERIGSITEWRDMTDELLAMAEVAEVVTAATRGDFSARISEDDKTGLIRDLAAGQNRINALIEEAMGDFSQTLAQVAEGDLMARTTGAFEGRFASWPKASTSASGGWRRPSPRSSARPATSTRRRARSMRGPPTSPSGRKRKPRAWRRRRRRPRSWRPPSSRRPTPRARRASSPPAPATRRPRAAWS